MSAIPIGHEPLFADPDVAIERRSDGSILVRSRQPLTTPDAHALVWLERWATRAPDRPFMAERDARGQWRNWNYAKAWRDARRIGAALRSLGHGPDRPLLMLAPNGLLHARLMLGAMAAAIPMAPANPQYASSAAGHARLATIAEHIHPSAVVVDDPARYAGALAMLAERGVPTLAADTVDAASIAVGVDTFSYAGLPSLQPDTPAKILFTSGSTGQPKAVVYTHGMMTSNVRMVLDLWPFLERSAPTLIDWLPWNHVFGANNNINLTLACGGTLYIDAGSPRPEGMQVSLANLREIAPTLYFNVPAGFAALLPHLEEDHGLRRTFFSQLQLLFYAGAAITQDTWDRLQRLAMAERGQAIPITCGWGATETGPTATLVHAMLDAPGNIGTPVPGAIIKLAPVGAKYELRVKSPSMASGYLGQPDATVAAFDEEGYYRTGDAGRLADDNDPSKGLIFDGRTAEDFKLATGTWVSVGPLRLALLAASQGLFTEALILAPNRPYIVALVWLDGAATRLDAAALRLRLQATLGAINKVGNSSLRIERLALAASPLSAATGEINEKTYLNQALARDARAAEIDALYADPLATGVVSISAA